MQHRVLEIDATGPDLHDAPADARARVEHPRPPAPRPDRLTTSAHMRRLQPHPCRRRSNEHMIAQRRLRHLTALAQALSMRMRLSPLSSTRRSRAVQRGDGGADEPSHRPTRRSWPCPPTCSSPCQPGAQPRPSRARAGGSRRAPLLPRRPLQGRDRGGVRPEPLQGGPPPRRRSRRWCRSHPGRAARRSRRGAVRAAAHDLRPAARGRGGHRRGGSGRPAGDGRPGGCRAAVRARRRRRRPCHRLGPVVGLDDPVTLVAAALHPRAAHRGALKP